MIVISTYVTDNGHLYKDVKLMAKKKTIWFKSIYINGVEKINTRYFLTEINSKDINFNKPKYKKI